MTHEPLFRLLMKEVPTVWNEQCEEALEKIKSNLMKPLVRTYVFHMIKNIWHDVM